MVLLCSNSRLDVVTDISALAALESSNAQG
jgi:hypothetical protein